MSAGAKNQELVKVLAALHRRLPEWFSGSDKTWLGVFAVRFCSGSGTVGWNNSPMFVQITVK